MMKRCERADEGEKRARAHGERRVQQRVTVRKERERERSGERRSHIEKVAMEASGSRNSRCFYSA